MKLLMLGPTDTVHVRRLATALADRNHDVHVIAPKPYDIPNITCSAFRVPPPSLRYPARWNKRWNMYMADLFAEFDVVTVHFLADWHITRDAIANGRLIVKPYGSDVDHPPHTPPPDPALVQTRIDLLKNAHAVTVASQFFRDRVATFANINPDNVQIIPDGVDTSSFNSPLKRDSDTITVGYHKGFKPVYAPDVLINAARIVTTKHPTTLFQLAGDGKLLDACRQQVADLNLTNNIQFPGNIPHENIPAFLADCDIIAIPSRKEGFCVAAIEASAAGIPVVTSRVGGLLETVQHDHTGIHVEPDNPKALANALMTLIENPDYRHRLGQSGRQFVKNHFEWSDCVDDWISLYESVLNQHPTPKRRSPLRRLLTAIG